MQRKQSTHIQTKHTDIDGQAALGHLFANQVFDQLFFTARWITARHRDDGQLAPGSTRLHFGYLSFQRLNCLRTIIFKRQ